VDVPSWCLEGGRHGVLQKKKTNRGAFLTVFLVPLRAIILLVIVVYIYIYIYLNLGLILCIYIYIYI
jgi:hypothetical protein